MFILETSAALLVILAMRGVLTGSGDPRLIGACALALWGGLFSVAVMRAIAIRRRWVVRRARSTGALSDAGG